MGNNTSLPLDSVAHSLFYVQAKFEKQLFRKSTDFQSIDFNIIKVRHCYSSTTFPMPCTLVSICL